MTICYFKKPTDALFLHSVEYKIQPSPGLFLNWNFQAELFLKDLLAQWAKPDIPQEGYIGTQCW